MKISTFSPVLTPVGLPKAATPHHVEENRRALDLRLREEDLDALDRAFPAEAPPLGIALDLVGSDGYPVTECALAGGCLAVFTDGVTEWRDAGGRMLGASGLKALLRELGAQAPVERLAALMARLDPGDEALHDDMTLLLVERPGPAA